MNLDPSTHFAQEQEIDEFQQIEASLNEMPESQAQEDQEADASVS